MPSALGTGASGGRGRGSLECRRSARQPDELELFACFFACIGTVTGLGLIPLDEVAAFGEVGDPNYIEEREPVRALFSCQKGAEYEREAFVWRPVLGGGAVGVPGGERRRICDGV